MSRIYYVEPNDVVGKSKNGVGLTPDYSDLSMSFNLVAEVTSRHNLIGNVDTQYIMTWHSKPSDSNSYGSRVSFLQGSDVEKYNYLTTYYSEADYQTLLKTTTVEGLGVSNCSVQYDSWYMPQVTIEFCDILGTSLFGREEAIHTGDVITSENVFGVFFTQPYPKFKLQIKGFYGDAVTLQLMCSKFDGKFDSSRGYFIATVSFIGYNYSLLTDIPLNFLIASPYSNYFGREYWESKKGSPEWALSDGSQPMKLFDLLLEVRKAQMDISDNVEDYITVEESSRVSEIKNAINELEGIALHYKNLQDSFYDKEESMFPSSQYTFVEGIEGDNEIVLIIPRKQVDLKNVPFSNYFKSNHKEYLDSIGRYNKKDNIFITPQHFFNHRQTTYTSDVSVKLIKVEKSNKLWDTVFNAYDPLDEEGVKKDINLVYCYKLIKGETISIVNSHIDTLKKESELIINSGISKINTTYESKISIKPYVGDITKILFCHLETFIQMVNHCSNVIDGNPSLRSPSNLGINSNQVTILNGHGNNNFIEPFPGIYANSSVETPENIVNTHVEAWLGDFSENYEEIKLIKGLYQATQMLNDLSSSLLEEKAKYEMDCVPVIPFDLYHGNPFKYVSIDLTKNISTFCGYIGHRLAQLSVLNFNGNTRTLSELFKFAGEADAINVYKSVGSKVLLSTQILEPCISNGGLYKTITDVITCNANGDKYANTTVNNSKYHDFEINKTKGKKRTSIFTSINDGYKYSFSSFKEEGNYVCFLPIVPNEQLTKSGIYNEKGCIIKTQVNGGLYDTTLVSPFCNVNPISSYVSEDSIAKYGGNKNSVFLVKNDSSFFNKLDTMMVYLSEGEMSLNQGEVKIDLKNRGISDMYIYDIEEISPFWSSKAVSKVIDKKILGSVEHIYAGYIGVNKIKVNEKNHKEFLVTGLTGTDVTKNEIGVAYGNTDTNTKNDGGLSYKSCLYLVANEEKHEYTKEGFDFKGSDGENTFFWQSEERLGHLFTSEAYYSFNDNFPYDKNLYEELGINNAKTCSSVHKNRRKAYLMAHTFEFDHIKIKEVLNKKISSKNHPFIMGLPIGYVWLVGAVLYRKEFNKLSKKSGKDFKDFLFNPNLSSSKNTKRTRALQYPSDDLTLLGKIKNWGDEDYRMDYSILVLTNKKENVENLYHIQINDLLPIKEYNDDVKWVFIKEFMNFSDNVFPIFSEQLELKRYDAKPFTDVELREFLSALYDNRWKNYGGRYSIGEYGIREDTISGTSSSFKVVTHASTKVIRDNMMNVDYYRANIVPLNGKYSYIQYYKDKNRLTALIDDDNPVQGLFSEMYKQPIILLISSNKTNINIGKREVISKTIYDTYLRSFEQKLKELCDVKDEVVQGGNDMNKDIAIPLYTNVKNIWDKWLVGQPNRNAFNVDPFFKDNFIFMDSFYKNIFKKFFLNYKKITDIYLSRRDLGSTLYSFLGDVASSHNMMFIAMSDFNNIGHEDETKAQENLERCFLPIPYNKMSEMQENNKFVFLYTHKPSSSASRENSNLLDNYNIWDNSKFEITPLANKLFNTPNDKTEQMTRYGFDVPSFGVSFGRQNNHLFKNINLTMDNPVQTEQSMLVLNDVVNLGANSANKVAFYGQDIYPIFSNYAYTCEIEMMGCAKIAPLMYFQLMNIPMWRGTYMIFNVSHQITPGNFVTKFKGMKMSAKALPYNTNFVYSKNGNEGIVYGNTVSQNSGDGSGQTWTNDSYPTIHDKDLKDYFSDPKYRKGNVNISGVSDEIKSLFNRLFETVRRMNENKEPNERYGIIISHAKRSGTSKSQHTTGHAIDLQMAVYGNGFDEKPTKTFVGGNQQKFLMTVMDIVSMNFITEVYQMIIEYTNGDVRADNYGFLVLHIGVRTTPRNSLIFIANDKNGSANLGLKWEQFKSKVVPEFKNIMAKFYNKGYKDLRKLSSIFSNLTKMSDVTQEKLDDWFKDHKAQDSVNISNVKGAVTNCSKDSFFGVGYDWDSENRPKNNKYNLYQLACAVIEENKTKGSKLLPSEKSSDKKRVLNQRETIIAFFTTLKKYGWKDYQIYALLAHSYGESWLDPKAKLDDGKGDGANGLFQYRNSSGVFKSFGKKYVEQGRATSGHSSGILSLNVSEQIEVYLDSFNAPGAKKYLDNILKSTNAIQALEHIIAMGYWSYDMVKHDQNNPNEKGEKVYKNKLTHLLFTIPNAIKKYSII